MDKKQGLTRSEAVHEIVALLLVLGLTLGMGALRYALLLPQYFD